MSTAPVDFGAAPPGVSKANGAAHAPTFEIVEPVAATRTPPSTLLDVAARWKIEGPLVHEPTGIPRLDELTGGGPVYGSRWYVLGAPDAGKTALLVQIADEWQARGIVVGFLAIDEEDGDLTTRFAQRRRFLRVECETRTNTTMREMSDAFAEAAGFFMYGAEWSIEAAAEDLAIKAKALSKEGEPPRRLALIVDTIQQARCNALCIERDREPSPREVVNENVRALRMVATKHLLLALATGEMNRNAYRSIDAAEQANDMAAAKESGAIEYSARVMLALRSVKDHGELTEVRMVKNKYGASWPAAEPFYLAIDRRTMLLTPAELPQDKVAAEDARAGNVAKLEREALDVLRVVAMSPGLGERTLRAKVAASGLRIGVTRLDAVVEHLVATGRIENRPIACGRRTDAHYHALSTGAGGGNEP